MRFSASFVGQTYEGDFERSIFCYLGYSGVDGNRLILGVKTQEELNLDDFSIYVKNLFYTMTTEIQIKNNVFWSMRRCR